MKRYTIDQKNPAEDKLRNIADELARGACAVVPTDSVYGLACAAFEKNPGHSLIFTLKKRDRAQTLPWLVGSPEDLDRFGKNVPHYARVLAEHFWPGALTLVVEASKRVPAEYARHDGTIALRCPKSVLIQKLTQKLGMPLAATSANTHGLPAATSIKTLEQEIQQGADLVIDAGAAPLGLASTVVDCSAHLPKIVREEALSQETLFAVL